MSEMRSRRPVSRVGLAKILYALVRSMPRRRANHVTVRPCRLSSWWISLPMCTIAPDKKEKGWEPLMSIPVYGTAKWPDARINTGSSHPSLRVWTLMSILLHLQIWRFLDWRIKHSKQCYIDFPVLHWFVRFILCHAVKHGLLSGQSYVFSARGENCGAYCIGAPAVSAVNFLKTVRWSVFFYSVPMWYAIGHFEVCWIPVLLNSLAAFQFMEISTKSNDRFGLNSK